MIVATMKHANKNRKPSATPQALPKPAAKRSMRTWVVLGLILLLSGVVSWAFMEYVVWNRLPGDLVGKWEVTSGPPELQEAVFDFYRNGKMVGHLNDQGNLRIMIGEVNVEDNKFYVTTRRPSTGETHVNTQTIRSLTHNQFTLVDEKGRTTQMVRIP